MLLFTREINFGIVFCMEEVKSLNQTGQPTPVLKKFSDAPLKKRNLGVIVATLVVILGGVYTGWLLSGESMADRAEINEATSQGVERSATEAGLEDESNLPDSAEGMLVEGGINGEGTHHLDRGLGETKYVYLTSTVIDLQGFVGKKVKVWGETLSGLKAGWLMDVGKIKVI